jgi:hypothetical protein
MASGFEHFNGYNQINKETSSTQTDEILILKYILLGNEKFPEEQSNSREKESKTFMSKEHRVEEFQEFKNTFIHISGVFNEFEHLKVKVDTISEELRELRSFTKDVMLTLRELTKSFIKEERTKSQKLTNLEEEINSLRSETFNAIEKSRIFLENHITYQLNRNEEKFAGVRERKNVKPFHED